jgi:hypothetical protein
MSEIAIGIQAAGCFRDRCSGDVLCITILLQERSRS